MIDKDDNMSIIVNTALKQSIYNFIRDNPYCDIEDIVEETGVLKNHVSRILGEFEKQNIASHEIDHKSGFGNYNSQGGSCFASSGWILVEQR